MHDKKEDRKTATFSIDTKTRLMLYKMVNNELLERVTGVISIGMYDFYGKYVSIYVFDLVI